VEAAARERWWRWGLQGRIVGIDHFGPSAPAEELFRQYGLTVEHVLQAIDGLFV
jgi:transketolase